MGIQGLRNFRGDRSSNWTPHLRCRVQKVHPEPYCKVVMYARAVSLAYGDSAVLATWLEMSKNGQFPLGHVMRSSSSQLLASCTYSWATILSQSGRGPLKKQSKLWAWLTWESTWAKSLPTRSPKQLQMRRPKKLQMGRWPPIDRVHALYGQACYLWLAQGGKEASAEDTPQDAFAAFAIARRISSVLELPEISQPKRTADRKKKITDAVLLSSFMAGVVDPAALVCLPQVPAIACQLEWQYLSWKWFLNYDIPTGDSTRFCQSN